MEEVTGPIVAITSVLAAVFVPAAFLPGLQGEFYRQFAITIAVSTVLSAVNSLTLSPALAGVMLKPHRIPRKGPIGWFFRQFNRSFDATARGYAAFVKRGARVSAVALVVYSGILVLGVAGTSDGSHRLRTAAGQVLSGGYRNASAGTSIERTDEVAMQMSNLMLQEPGVESVVAFPVCRLMALSPCRMLRWCSPCSILSRCDRRRTFQRMPLPAGCKASLWVSRVDSHSYSHRRPFRVLVPSEALSCKCRIAEDMDWRC